MANIDIPNAVPTPALAVWLSSVPGLDLGGYGVALFFLISGFVIPISLHRYSVRGFAVGRLLRIWPTYAAGFVVTVVAIEFSSLHTRQPFPYSFVEVAIHSVPGLRDVLWSRYIDGVIWTLEVEVKFYLVCALAAPLVRRESLWLFAVPLAIALACRLVTGTIDAGPMTARHIQVLAVLAMSGQFIVFMFVGTVMAYAHREKCSWPLALVLSGALICSFVWLTQVGPWRTATVSLPSYGAALLTFVAALALWRPRNGSPALLRYLAKISYPLYACHQLLGYAVIAVLLQVGVPALLAITSALACTVGVATLIHYLVEAPSHRLGQALARRLSAKSVPVVHALVPAQCVPRDIR